MNPAEPTGGAAEVVRLSELTPVLVVPAPGSEGPVPPMVTASVGVPSGLVFVEDGSALVYLSTGRVFDLGWLGVWVVLWLIRLALVASVVWIVARFRHIVRNPRQRGRDYCRACNYPAAGVDGRRCPECGASLTPATIAIGRSVWRRVRWPAIMVLLSGAVVLLTTNAHVRLRVGSVGVPLIMHAPELDHWMDRRGITQPEMSLVLGTQVVRFDPVTGARRVLFTTSGGYLGVLPALGPDPATLVVPDTALGVAVIDGRTGKRLESWRTGGDDESFFSPTVLFAPGGVGIEAFRIYAETNRAEWVRFERDKPGASVVRALEPDIRTMRTGRLAAWSLGVKRVNQVAGRERWMVAHSLPGDDPTPGGNDGTSRIELWEEGSAAPLWALVMPRMYGGMRAAARVPVMSMESLGSPTAPIVGLDAAGKPSVMALGIGGSLSVRVLGLDSDGGRALVVWTGDSGVERAGVVDLRTFSMTRELLLDQPFVMRGTMGPDGRVALVVRDPKFGQTLEVWGPEGEDRGRDFRPALPGPEKR